MLVQLLHAGVIDAQRAVLLGQVSRYTLSPHDRGYDLPVVVRWLRTQTRTPVITGLPFGHGEAKALLAVGEAHRLRIDAGFALLERLTRRP